jgi:hypothetical protein
LSNKNIYLVAHHYLKPKHGVNTSRKGWMNDRSNFQYDERVEITRGLKGGSKTASIILNLSKKSVESNQFNGDRNFRALFKYFFEGYDKYITQVMSQVDPDYLKGVLDEIEEEIKSAEANETPPQ